MLYDCDRFPSLSEKYSTILKRKSWSNKSLLLHKKYTDMFKISTMIFVAFKDKFSLPLPSTLYSQNFACWVVKDTNECSFKNSETSILFIAFWILSLLLRCWWLYQIASRKYYGKTCLPNVFIYVNWENFHMAHGALIGLMIHSN